MINPATNPHDELNDFTNKVRMIARDLGADNYWIQLRNGELIRPVFVIANDEYSKGHFTSEDGKYNWYLNGTSVTRSRYDMMSIVKKEG